jgi:hypothetical protein
MLSKNEQGFANVCGTSSVQANSEAAEVADEINRMIEKDRSFIDEVEPTATYLFFSGDRATFAACPSIGWDALSTQELKGSERKRKKCYKI